MHHPSGAALLNPSGKAPSAGEVFRNPDMAGVLRELGAGGKEAFYGGRIGEAVVEVLREMGGVLTVEDLKVTAGEQADPCFCSCLRAQRMPKHLALALVTSASITHRLEPCPAGVCAHLLACS